MRETWLKLNLRPRLPRVILFTLCAVASVALLVRGLSSWVNYFVVFVAVAALSIELFFGLTRVPLLAYRNGRLIVFRGRDGMAEVPIELVEGFLLGQGPSYLPGRWASRLDVATIVVKLADRAEEWEHQEMDSRYGSWCGHYITIRGTACEPISLELVNRLNARLYEVTHTAQNQQAGV